MNLKSISVYCLSLLAGMLSLVSSVMAQTPSFTCTPVVYVFRHAEDFDKKVEAYPCLPGSAIKCTTKLTPVGMEHANLYVEMIESLERKEDFCPLAEVYAVNPILPNGSGGTTNPFYTAKPLSDVVMDEDPIIEVVGLIIDQDLKVFPPQGLMIRLTNEAGIGLSSALFWTSEGLHDVGVALGTEIIPEKGPGFPPRNAAYIFKYNSGTGSFDPPTAADEYIQCFNYAKGGRSADNFTNKFYCGNLDNGSLDIPKNYFDQLHARICATADLTKISSPSGYYGYCEWPPTGSAP